MRKNVEKQKKHKSHSFFQSMSLKGTKVLIVYIIMLCIPINVLSQSTKLNLKMTDASVKEVLQEIKKQTTYDFMYEDDLIKDLRRVNIDMQNATISQILYKCFEGSNVAFKIDDKIIMLTPKSFEHKKVFTVSGTVTDEAGNPLPGANVLIEGKGTGTITNLNGEFLLELSDPNTRLGFTFVGYEPQLIEVGEKRDFSIILLEQTKGIEEVVITGLGIERRRETFTGATTVVKGEKIMSLNPQNIFEVLEVVDPEFTIEENVSMGSDPNQLQEVRVRGNSSLPAIDEDSDLERLFEGDPNAPVFIVDGFETPMSQVFDIPPSRIESITILKDAAATSMYGSVSLNGVIVIELKKPEAGKIKVNYRLATAVTTPDLSTYDLLNAEQKLELEKIRGLDILSDEYNGKQKYIAQGVNTDWMSKPVRTGLNLNHNIGITGGSDAFTYRISLNANPTHGVMKGSFRDRYSGGMTVTYRVNKFHFTNSLNYAQVNAENSPYGSFDEYAQMNPYLPSTDANGDLLYTIEPEGYSSTIENPVWNTSIGMFDKTVQTVITNNFQTRYNPFKFLILNAQVSYSRSNTENDAFKPFNHTDFSNATEKGSYAYSANKSITFMSRFGASFIYDIGKHSINLNTSVNYQNNKNDGTGFIAVDIPSENLSHPIFAGKFKDNTSPNGSSSIRRSAGYLATLNYTFDHKLYTDLTFRTDISSVFGDINPWASFWSAGIGYNLEREEFIKDIGISQFRLKASIGNNGSQSFNAYQALQIYGYNTSYYYYGMGVAARLKGFGNPELKWQSALTANISADIGILKNNLTFGFNYYNTVTSDAIVTKSLPDYLGFGSYYTNLGGVETKGYSFNLSANLIRKENIFLSVNLNGSHRDEKMIDLMIESGDAYENHNERLMNSQQTSPYNIVRDGASVTERYVRKSLGIDPATGKELFMDENGNETFNYMDAEMIPFEPNPDLAGSFGFSLRIKQLSISSNFQYQLGGETFNSTVLNKVENIGNGKGSNYDKRVFSQRWRSPGDVTFYKDINNTNDTYASSRFLQNASFIKHSSLNISYRFKREIIEKLRLEGLELSFITNNLFYLQYIRLERGTSYPFARTYNFSISVNL